MTLESSVSLIHPQILYLSYTKSEVLINKSCKTFFFFFDRESGIGGSSKGEENSFKLTKRSNYSKARCFFKRTAVS